MAEVSVADQIAQLRRQIEELEAQERRARQEASDPIRQLCAVVQAQNETVLAMFDKMLTTLEHNLDRSLAFYARDAAMTAAKVRRLSPDRAATESPSSQEPPKVRDGEAAGSDVVARGRPEQLKLGDELLGTEAPAIRDPLTRGIVGVTGYVPPLPHEM